MSVDDRTLDRFDLEILRILQEDCALPQRRIAERVNLSAPAVQRRLRRLQKSGVIQRQVALVAPERVGRPITIIVHVAVNNEHKNLHEAIKKRFSSAREIQQCYYVTGEADFILVITVTSMEEFGALSQRLFIEDENIRSFKTYVVLDRVKWHTALPL